MSDGFRLRLRRREMQKFRHSRGLYLLAVVDVSCAGPFCERGEPQFGCGVATVSVAFNRARLCINKALRA